MITPNFLTRVVLVDDDPLGLTTLCAILEGNGCSVRTAEDGFAGLKLLRETLPDIILTDLGMPNMSGFELLSIVRHRFPQIPTIAISGEFFPESMTEGLLVDAFLEKGSYEPQELFQLMRRLLTDPPIRPQLVKVDQATLWIPRRETGYIVVTCTECLRAFPVDRASTGGELRDEPCPTCGTVVRYRVDSGRIEILESRASKASRGPA